MLISVILSFIEDNTIDVKLGSCVNVPLGSSATDIDATPMLKCPTIVVLY